MEESASPVRSSSMKANQESAQNPTQEEELEPLTTGHGPQFDKLINEFRELFSGKCKPMKTGKHHIELKENAVPINTGATRNISEPLRPALKRTLDNMENDDIIRPYDQATPWLHPIVVVPKKGTAELRLCIDFKRLNEHVKRPINPQPTPWETIRNLPKGITHYAVFDALKGYHQIELDEESQKLTAFMTPFGRYVFKRLPMGLSSAGDVFTLVYGNATDEATNGLRATEDTLIRGATTQELLENTRRFFQACQKNGITLNTKKIQWDQKEVLFGGFLLGPNGYQPDPNLARALSEFPLPKNATDMRSFFGLANQLCNFSDTIAEILCPLKSLLKKGTQFQWLPEHEEAFQNAKQHLSSNKTLTYYCPKRKTRLISDASRLFGLGFVLKQQQDNGEWKPVQAGSRFITTAETNYAMCELELLGIVWACTKTRMFTEGLEKEQFEIWTDHSPLVSILDKQTLPEITNKRLQRLRMKIDHLTFTTKWVKGTENIEADCLSRHPCAHATEEDELDEEVKVAAINMLTLAHDELLKPDLNVSNSVVTPSKANQATVQSLQPSDRDLTDDRLRELKLFASEDPIYQQIVQHTVKGFPDVRSEDIPDKLKPFFKIRDSLTLDSDGFLCKQDQFVVPEKLIQTYLRRLHAMHQGAAKMTARARASLWWPYMSRDISTFSKTCLPCETTKASNPVEAILSHEPATYPFQFIHMDIGQEQGRYYLITTDQYSGYPHINDTGKTCTTKQVINATIDLITHFSIPEIIYSDGGPQFIQDGEFDVFCKEWGIRHILSSPYMPRSNGHAEAAVKQMKKLIQANLSSNGVLNRQSALAGLQVFRNTPRQPSGKSPAELIFGHKIRDSIPIQREALLPEYRFKQEQRLFNHRQNLLPDKEKYGPTRELPLLAPKTPVRIQNPISKKWDLTGFIVSFGQNTREYLVRAGHKIMRRNRHFLKKIEVEAVSPVKQPAQAPMRPDTPQSSAFPVQDNWFEKPASEMTDEEAEALDIANHTSKVKFSIKPKESESEPSQQTKPGSNNPDPITELKSDPKYKAKKPPSCTWPNNKPVSPKKMPQPIQESSRKQNQNSFSSTNNRRDRMGNTSPSSIPISTTPLWDTNSNWRTPRTTTAMTPPKTGRSRSPNKNKDAWDKDSKWKPPAITTPMIPGMPRPKRSANMNINYNEED